MKSGIQFEDADLKALIEDAVKKNCAIRIRAKGNSMFPAIKNKDVVTIYPYGKRVPAVGDIAAFVLPGQGNKLLIHRLIETKGQFIFKGDNLPEIDGMVDRTKILGVVKKVETSRIQHLLQSEYIQKVVAWLSKYNLIFILNKISIKIGHIICLY